MGWDREGTGGGGSGGADGVFVGASVVENGGQSIGTGVATKVALNTAPVVDTDGFFDDANDRLVVPAGLDGYYRARGAVYLVANETSNFFLRILVNGAAPLTTIVQHVTVRGAVTDTPALSLVAGDYVELSVFTAQGRNLAAASLDLVRVAGGAQADADWHEVGTSGEPAFGTGWDSYDSFNGAALFGPVAFRILPSGLVVIKGAADGSASAGSTIFTLPAGYRPAHERRFAAIRQNLFGQLLVQADGTVKTLGASAGDYVALDCAFYADQ
ncbi:MAG TPA: hypothetical protein VGA69_00845 [Nitriliruptorales bacterium]